MQLHLKVFLLVCLLCALIFMVRQIRKKKILLQYTLSWMFLVLGLALVILFPSILDIVSGLMGIAVPVNTVFFLGFLFALIIIYNLTAAVSRMSTEITHLTQEVALMKKKAEEEDTGN